jgi:hypothetical protein
MMHTLFRIIIIVILILVLPIIIRSILRPYFSKRYFPDHLNQEKYGPSMSSPQVNTTSDADSVEGDSKEA